MLDYWMEILLRDVGDTPVARLTVAVIDLDPARGDAVAGLLPDAASWVTPGAHRRLLRAGRDVVCAFGELRDHLDG